MLDSTCTTPHLLPGFKPKFRARAPLVLTTTLLSFSLASWYILRSDKPKLLDPYTYSPALVTAHTHPTPHTSLLRLRLTSPAPTPSPFYALWIKSPHVQIERPYTPLRGIEAENEVELWIKHENGGEVSRYLGGKKAGDEIEVRGWTKGIEWVDQGWDEVVMISGGTGITPFYQLLDHLFLQPSATSPSPTTRFTLLHGSLTPSELPPSSILKSLAELQRSRPESFSLRLFVDTLPSDVASIGVPEDVPPLTVRRIQQQDLALAVNPSSSSSTSRWNVLCNLFSSRPSAPLKDDSKKVLFLVCGPEPMVEAFAGPRARDLTEGKIGGMLGAMGYGKGEVRKL